MVTTDYAIGADLSFLKQAEEQGTIFRENGQPKPGLSIFKNHGYNWIRLRLFHSPTELPNDLEYTIALARDAKKLGFKFLLDFHYSDGWADPAQQFVPKAWQGKSQTELIQAVHEYTRDTMRAFRDADVYPNMVQIGNEVINGMLWPNGKLPQGWDNFAALLQAGIAGVDAERDNRPRAQIMIHIDRGADLKRTRSFFDALHSYDLNYDIMGQSYYSWWHGPLSALRENLHFMANTYDKDIMLVEVAYCWRPTEYVTGEALYPDAPFPETPDGQKRVLEAVNQIVMELPNGRGKGVFWWEPAVSGHLRNRGFFDDDGNALPVIGAFDRFVDEQSQQVL